MTAAGPNCNLDLCRTAKFVDNVDWVQQYVPGQDVRFTAILLIPHEDPMNVSIVDTATDTAVGQPLIFYDIYADESLPQLPRNNTDFSATMPSIPAGVCTTPGACTLQWAWTGIKARQSYQSSVDFVMVI